MLLVIVPDLGIGHLYGSIPLIAVRYHHELHSHGIVVVGYFICHHKRVYEIAGIEQTVVFYIILVRSDSILKIVPEHSCLAGLVILHALEIV